MKIIGGLVAAILITLGTWIFLVVEKYGMPPQWWVTLPHWLRHTFDNATAQWIAAQAAITAIGTVAALSYALHDNDDNRQEKVVRGTKKVRGAKLAAQTKLRTKRGVPVQVELAGIPVPPACEPSHFLLAGSTNTGKSTAMDGLLAKAMARGDRAVLVDPNGHAFSIFGTENDVLLNPFDARSPGWSLFNEFRKPYDFERFAKSIVPNSNDPGSQQWHAYAQQLLAETVRAMAQSGENTTERLLYWLTQASASTLSEFLAGSAASGLFEPGAEKALASTRFILSHHVGAQQYLQPGDFSLRDWLENGTGNLYITWREDMLQALRPLVSGWVDILIASILTLPTENPRPLWLMLDELASLEQLTSLEAGLTKGRKHGLRVVAGLQSIAQLDARYGRDTAQTLRSCFRNVLALGCSNADAETAEAIAKGLGQADIERAQLTFNNGHSGQSTSKSMQRSTEYVVLPSELMSLPPLRGFLKLAGDFPVAEIRLQPGNYPTKNTAFQER